MSQDPGTDGMLEALQKLLGKAGGLVEAKVGFRIGCILNRVILNFLEEPIDHAHVIVKVRVQRRAEAMQEADRADGGGW